MEGLAQKLFFERTGSTPWLAGKGASSRSDWPALDKMLARRYLAYIDYALARNLLKNEDGEACGAFLCHLSAALRRGHLCIKIGQGTVFPHPKDLWKETFGEQHDSDTVYQEEDFHKITQLILEGASSLSTNLMADVNDIQLDQYPVKPVCRYNDCFYFQRSWIQETHFLQHLRNLISTEPEFAIDAESVKNYVTKLQSRNQLLKEQAEAILESCKKRFTIICGGPGTGKTYTAGHLIKAYWESLDPDMRKRCNIALAAPTGKAAANLQKSLSKAIQDIPDFKPIQAKTLHALLGINPHKMRPSAVEKLAADLILVDESSMIDLQLMVHLFAAIKPGARLILLGDKHQLPSVEAGSLFADLVTCGLSLVELKVCLRTELIAILNFASIINTGDGSKALTFLNDALPSQGLTRKIKDFSQAPQTDGQQALFDYTYPFFKDFQSSDDEDPTTLFDVFNRFRILSPLRKGPFGIDQLNAFFLKRLLKLNKDSKFTAPIILTANDQRLEMFNGEVGILVRTGNSDKAIDGDYALFPGRTPEEPVRKVPAILLPRYDYAYCLSVYKSQGSEFDSVLLLLPQGSEIFGREAFYTGVTRARHNLEIWGSDIIIKTIVEKQSHRLSGVQTRILCNC